MARALRADLHDNPFSPVPDSEFGRRSSSSSARSLSLYAFSQLRASVTAHPRAFLSTWFFATKFKAYLSLAWPLVTTFPKSFELDTTAVSYKKRAAATAFGTEPVLEPVVRFGTGQKRSRHACVCVCEKEKEKEKGREKQFPARCGEQPRVQLGLDWTLNDEALRTTQLSVSCSHMLTLRVRGVSRHLLPSRLGLCSHGRHVSVPLA